MASFEYWSKPKIVLIRATQKINQFEKKQVKKEPKF